MKNQQIFLLIAEKIDYPNNNIYTQRIYTRLSYSEEHLKINLKTFDLFCNFLQLMK